jgi:hypothetical protein
MIDVNPIGCPRMKSYTTLEATLEIRDFCDQGILSSRMIDEDIAEARQKQRADQTKDERSTSRFLGPVVKMRGRIEKSGRYNAAYFLHAGCFGIRDGEVAAVGGRASLLEFGGSFVDDIAIAIHV